MSGLNLGNVFCPAPKHMIRLSFDYRQDLKILIGLWKSLAGDTHNAQSHASDENYCAAENKTQNVQSIHVRSFFSMKLKL